MKSIFFAITFLTLFGCANLPKEEIKPLRNCDTSLKQARLNLLKRGYALKADEKDFFITDLRNVNFGFSFPTSFAVKATGPESIRFTTKIDVGEGEHDAPFISTNEDYHKDIRRVICSKTLGSL